MSPISHVHFLADLFERDCTGSQRDSTFRNANIEVRGTKTDQQAAGFVKILNEYVFILARIILIFIILKLYLIFIVINFVSLKCSHIFNSIQQTERDSI